jgi:hypothetical protein
LSILLPLFTLVVLAIVWAATARAIRPERWRRWHGWAIGLPAIASAAALPYFESLAAALAVLSALVFLVLHAPGRLWFWFAAGTLTALVVGGVLWLVSAVGGGIVPIMLMIGSPGTGKTMLARRLPTILPPLTPSESLSTTRIYSALGQLPADEPLMATRPFRSPRRTYLGGRRAYRRRAGSEEPPDDHCGRPGVG